VTTDIEIAWYSGPRADLRDLFALAEDSPQRLAASIEQGRVLVATEGGSVVAYLQLVGAEVHSMAVAEHRQRQGLGRELMQRAIAECRAEGAHTLVVATASADIGNLRFYQRLGFRMLRVERDAFSAAEGYPEGLTIDGIPLRDRVWLTLALRTESPS
jgi:GNAT superfamily N-acetyltransferase